LLETLSVAELHVNIFDILTYAFFFRYLLKTFGGKVRILGSIEVVGLDKAVE